MDKYEKLIYENIEKGYQYRLTVSEFRDQEYLHVRKYFLTYEGDWIPSREGASIPCTISNTYALLDGLLEVVSKAEGSDGIVTHLENKISNLKKLSE